MLLTERERNLRGSTSDVTDVHPLNALPSILSNPLPNGWNSIVLRD